MFQMGDEYSDWEGLKYTFTEGVPISDASSQTLTQTKVSNSRLQTTVDLYDVEESSFRGYISLNTVHTGCVLTLIRETPEDEVTRDDGQVWRIEAYTNKNKRNLQGIAFDNAGYS